jgi:Fe-S oxidoreductase
MAAADSILLINPPTSRPMLDDIFFPMGLVALGTLLKQRGIPVQILDFEILFREEQVFSQEADFEKYFLEKLQGSRAGLFGISSICSNFPDALFIAQILRRERPDAFIVLGGPQPSSVPLETLENFPEVDAIVVGEGERTFLELVQCGKNPAAMRKIPGLAFRDGRALEKTPPRDLIQDLDELPIPDFGLLDLKRYLAHSPGMALIEAGRGCPFSCNFCSTAEFWSRKYRAKSPGRILQEMSVLHGEYGLSYFPLTHDNFTTSPKYIRQFLDFFIPNNGRALTWDSSARTDTLKTRELAQFRAAGCRGLFFGVDSGSPRVQKAIDKHLDLEEYKEILEESAAQDIGAVASFILGFPDETREELEETLLLGLWSKGHGARSVQFHRLSPLAGTAVYAKNRQGMTLSPMASDISPYLSRREELWNWVESFPNLFSSFYSIPTPHLEGLDLFHVGYFYMTVFNQMGPAIDWLFGKRKKRPLEIYEAWREYTRQKHPDQLYRRETILESFEEFI